MMRVPRQKHNASSKAPQHSFVGASVRQTGKSPQQSQLVQTLSRVGNAANAGNHAALLNRAPASQKCANKNLLLHLQRQYGNSYVNQVVNQAQENSGASSQHPPLQTKLTIGPVGDKYEREADQTAAAVVQRINAPAAAASGGGQTVQAKKMPEEELQKKPQITAIQRQEMLGEKEEEEDKLAQMKPETNLLQSKKQPEEEEKDKSAQKKPEIISRQPEKQPEEEESDQKIAQRQPLVQRRSGEGSTDATADLESSIKHVRGKGRPLQKDIRESMEQAFGADFSSVRIHTDADADQMCRSIQSRAFTVGQDIFFRQGEYAPGSKRGQELLAHELTHVVQQNGSTVRTKAEQKEKGFKSSQNIKLQRACSKCEKGEKEKGIIQAKEESSAPRAAKASSEECSVGASGQEKKTESDTESSKITPPPSNAGDDCSQANNTNEQKTYNCNQADDTDKQKTEDEQNKQEQSCSSCPSEKEDQNQEQSEQEETPQIREKLAEPTTCDRQEQKPNFTDILLNLTKGILSSLIPEAKEEGAKPETTAENQQPTAPPELSTPQQNLQATGEAVSPKTFAEKAEAITTATEAQGRLRNTDAEVARLASTKINFKLPKQEEIGRAEKNREHTSVLKRQRATASRIASNFFAEAGFRVQTVTGLGQTISGQINGATEKAKASVISTVQQQKDTVTSQISQQRIQVQNQAQVTLAELEKHDQETVTHISQETEVASQNIQTEYSNTFQKLDEEKNNLLTKIDQLYFDTYDQYIAAGEEVGNEAINMGKREEDKYLSKAKEKREKHRERLETVVDPKKERIYKPSDVEDSDKQARTAQEVANQYEKQVKNEATKQANNLAQGKAKDIEGICCGITEVHKELQRQQEETLKAVNDLQQYSLCIVGKARTKLTEDVHQTRQATLQSLNEQETAQLQILEGYSQRQVLAIERDAQKAITSLQNGANQAAAKLVNALKDYYNEFQGMEAPNPDELSVTLAEILEQFDSSVATVRRKTQTAIAASTQGIKQGEQQAVGALNAIAQTGIEESQTVVEEAKALFVQLNQGIKDTFTQFKEKYTEAANKFFEDTQKGLAQINPAKTFNCIYQKLDTALQKSVTDLKQGLDKILDCCLEKDIQRYAAKAVEREPFWKTILKGLLFVAVIVVAIFSTPIAVGVLASALGGGIIATAVAGIVVGATLGASLGVLTQMANNAIDGKNLMDGVGEAALVGWIGGAIGGVGGALTSKIGATGLSTTLSKFGIETASDLVGNIFGDLAVGNPITWQGVLGGVALGTSIYISTTKGNLRRLGKPGKKLLDFQQRSSVKGMQFGDAFRSKVMLGKRSTHHDKPEIEPGVVAKQRMANGHELKVLKDGRVIRCSTCEDIEQRYAYILKQRPNLKKRLDEIKLSNPMQKARLTEKFDQELNKIIRKNWVKRKHGNSQPLNIKDSKQLTAQEKLSLSEEAKDAPKSGMNSVDYINLKGGNGKGGSYGNTFKKKYWVESNHFPPQEAYNLSKKYNQIKANEMPAVPMLYYHHRGIKPSETVGGASSTGGSTVNSQWARELASIMDGETKFMGKTGFAAAMLKDAIDIKNVTAPNRLFYVDAMTQSAEYAVNKKFMTHDDLVWFLNHLNKS